MLVKIIGGVLLVVGGLLALKMLMGVIWAVLSVAVVVACIWGGWRLLKS